MFFAIIPQGLADFFRFRVKINYTRARFPVWFAQLQDATITPN